MSRKLLVGGIFAALALAAAPSAASATEVAAEWYQNHALVGATHVTGINWGEFQLVSGAVGKIHCQNVMNFSIWNENGKGVGQFEGWGTNACKAPELEETLEKAYEVPIKEGRIKAPLTIFATSELPLRPEIREGEICVETTKKPEQCKGEGERELDPLLYSGLHRRGSGFPWKMHVTYVERNKKEVVVDTIGLPPEGQTCFPLESTPEGERPVSWEKVPSGCVKINVVSPQIPAEVVFYGVLEPQISNGTKNGLFPSRLKYGAEAGKLISSRGEAPETETSGEMKIMGMAGQELLTAK